MTQIIKSPFDSMYERYTVNDLGCAVALVASGFALVEVKLPASTSELASFDFYNLGRIQDAENSYKWGGLGVDAQNYQSILVTLKSIVGSKKYD